MMGDMSADLALLNRVANQPEILPHIAPGMLRVDLTNFSQRPGNLMLGNEKGLVLFINLGEGLYACHWLLTSSIRGADALRVIREAFSTLFTLRDCVAITGLIPHENRASRVMARALGCRPIGEAQDFSGRSCTSYIMERSRWAILSGA